MNSYKYYKDYLNNAIKENDLGDKQDRNSKLNQYYLSGTVVRKYLDYYKIDLKDILVIHDDLDMEVGRIKIKCNGSSGGHNGIKNIIENVGSEKFMRLKVGISKNNNYDTKDYVLGKFSKEDKELLNKKKNVVNNIIDDFIMGRYNGVNNENI